MELRCSEELEQKDDRLTGLINEKGVCRTAPATLGLLNMAGTLQICYTIFFFLFSPHSLFLKEDQCLLLEGENEYKF